jgi:hypothetical protein
MNPWVKFLKENRGRNLSVVELRDMYLQHKAAATASVPVSVPGPDEPVYTIDNNADIKVESMLEDFKDEYNISGITKKLDRHDEITKQEEEVWKLGFEMALTDDYAMTKEQLLGSHNWWLTRLEYHSGIDEVEFDDILNSLTRNHASLYDFLDDVLNSFSVEELHTIDLPEMR